MKTGEKVAITAIVLSLCLLGYRISTGAFSGKKKATEVSVNGEEVLAKDPVREALLKEMESLLQTSKAEVDYLKNSDTESVDCQFVVLTPKEKVDIPVENKSVEPEDVKTDGLLYTSFLGMGPDTLAVINGISYKSGEKLLNSPLIVSKITSDFVVLKDLENIEYKVAFEQEKK